MAEKEIAEIYKTPEELKLSFSNYSKRPKKETVPNSFQEVSVIEIPNHTKDIITKKKHIDQYF